MNEKTKNWLEKVRQTKEKRKSQVCKVYELKFDYSHLSNEKINYLQKLFLEAKWLYNYILSQEDFFKFDSKIKNITSVDKDKNIIDRELRYLSSQMRQAMLQKAIWAVKALSTKKKKGKSDEVGRLKFKSRVDAIVLNQYKVTYKIENKNYIKLQGFKKHFKVSGLNQIPYNAELANATLVRRNGNYYLKVTCFLPKEEKERTGKVIGLDFGIKDSVITSDGDKYLFNFLETKAIKKASRKMNKKKKGSHNRFKTKMKLRKRYEKLSNKKKDTRNKFVSKLIKENDVVAIQNESIHAWHSSKMNGFGRRIQHSIMGGIISDLKKKSETVIIDKWFPSTKLCPACGKLNKPSLEDRIYNCECGYSQDRDIHSARNILTEGLKKIDMEYINPMPVEKLLDLRLETFGSNLEHFSLKQEASMSLASRYFTCAHCKSRNSCEHYKKTFTTSNSKCGKLKVYTAIAIGPDKSEVIDDITKDLKLL